MERPSCLFITEADTLVELGLPAGQNFPASHFAALVTLGYESNNHPG